MPRRNRNAGTPRPDTDQLAADLAQLAADLHYTPHTGRSALLVRYLAAASTPASVVAVPCGKQPVRQLVLESR
jgi:hypothetical protein